MKYSLAALWLRTVHTLYFCTKNTKIDRISKLINETEKKRAHIA